MTKLIIRRQQQTAPCYTERLGADFALDMMLIPPGQFMMGTPEREIERLCQEYGEDYFRMESPEHQVNISSFFMGKYPVTQKQWKAIAHLAPVDRELDPDPSYFKQPYQEQDRWTRPVEQVSWEEAVEFCKRLSRETKRNYRLPSEAEWEYACRGGTNTNTPQKQCGSYPPPKPEKFGKPSHLLKPPKKNDGSFAHFPIVIKEAQLG